MSGVVQSDIVKYEGVPVNQTFVNGVDLADGHLTASSNDVSIAGPGPALSALVRVVAAKPLSSQTNRMGSS